MKAMYMILSLGLLLMGTANAQRIDLDASSNGNGNPVSLTLEPGTYTIDPIGISAGGSWDAWNAWGRTTCTTLGGCSRTLPTTVVGWLNVYSFHSASVINVLINGSAATPAFGNTYHAGPFVAYPDPASALTDAWSSTFTLTTESVVRFALPDDKLSDNLGGMTLDLNKIAAYQPVPEPEVIALLGIGLVGLAALRRRKNKVAA